MELEFRKAIKDDSERIWIILQQAIERRHSDGSLQWQNGYPNPEIIAQDIDNQVGFVLSHEGKVQAYAAIILNDEPAYRQIEGQWLSNGDFYVIHRVAVSDEKLGQGYAKALFKFAEKLAIESSVSSLRVDTNFDNPAMLHVFKKAGFIYCGEVLMKGAMRKAYEKLL